MDHGEGLTADGGRRMAGGRRRLMTAVEDEAGLRAVVDGGV
jgi:hypothetical protein